MWVNGLHIGSISQGTVTFGGRWVVLAYRGDGEPCGVCDSEDEAVDRLTDAANIALIKYRHGKGRENGCGSNW